jgi:hypothetical protein
VGFRVRVLICVAAGALVLSPSVATSETAKGVTTPVQVSLWTPIQMVPSATRVMGFRLNLPYGHTEDLYGFDIGTVNRVTSKMRGLQIGGIQNLVAKGAGIQVGMVNRAEKEFAGLQCAWLLNLGTGETHGAQLGLFSMSDRHTGVQAGVVNENAGGFTGLQLSLGANVGGELGEGAQIGLYNVVKGPMTGVQVGFINSTGSLRGVQIGILNVRYDGGPILPVINVGW